MNKKQKRKYSLEVIQLHLKHPANTHTSKSKKV